MQITTIGLDLAKSVFQVHGVDATGQVVVRKSLRRSQMLPFFTKLPPCLVGIEERWWRCRVLAGEERDPCPFRGALGGYRADRLAIDRAYPPTMLLPGRIPLHSPPSSEHQVQGAGPCP